MCDLKVYVLSEAAIDRFYSEQNMDRLKRSIAQMESNGGAIHEVDVDGT